MSLQQLKSLIQHKATTRGMRLSLGIFVLIGSSSASAFTPLASKARAQQYPTQISQTTAPDVVVDTEQPQRTTPTRSSPSSTTTGDRRFTCNYVNGQYTVMYNPEDQAGQAYPWAVPRRMGGGWSPERRCKAISQRLESYRPDGLQELRTAVMNDQDIVCATTQAVSSCRIVFTVPPGQDPELTRDRVFENLTIANRGQQTQGVNTYTSQGEGGNFVEQLGQVLNSSQQQSDAINLQPFLAREDGGTATQLRSGSTTEPSNNSDLNPEDFR